MAHRDWNERYLDGNIPWDTGIPEPLLVEAIRAEVVSPGRALEVGCGTGTNARWLAEQGFEVLGVDIASDAVERARAIEPAAGAAPCRFEVADFLAQPLADTGFDFVFDRGCFHTLDDADDRARFAANVAGALNGTGVWLSVIGSTEGPARDVGPPRRSARDVIAAIEPSLELVRLETAYFHPHLDRRPKAWLALARRREVPAQPSTRRG